jgi:hypothetical protein
MTTTMTDNKPTPPRDRRCSMNPHNGGIAQHVFVSVADNVEALQFAEAVRQEGPRRAGPKPYTMASTNSRNGLNE